MDTVFIERLWRSLKYECVDLHAFELGSKARTGIGRWIDCYNVDRPHSAFGGKTPAEAHQGVPAGIDWRHDTDLNQAYPGRKTVRAMGTISDEEIEEGGANEQG